MVFQSYALFPHKTVATNVAFGMKMRGVSRSDMEARTREALRLVKLDRTQHLANVESATVLPADLQVTTHASLTRRYGPGLTITFAERPSLIGGMRIQVGSDVYDGSVLAELAELEKSF